ncbi:MAG: hypothetical protein ACE366_22640 [Bradymonadia bacterium]
MQRNPALKAAICFGALVSLTLFASAVVPSDAFLTALLNLVFTTDPGPVTPGTRLCMGMAGGIMFGWMVHLWALMPHARPTDRQLARALLTGLAAWFVVDSAASLISGGGLNAVGNLGFLMLFGLPLMGPARKAEAGGGLQSTTG